MQLFQSVAVRKYETSGRGASRIPAVDGERQSLVATFSNVDVVICIAAAGWLVHHAWWPVIPPARPGELNALFCPQAGGNLKIK